MLAGRLRDPHDLLGPRKRRRPRSGSARSTRRRPRRASRARTASRRCAASTPPGSSRRPCRSAIRGTDIRFHNDERDWEQEDPYRFSPTLGELDLHLIGEGTHAQLWRVLGARIIEHEGVLGTAFSVWAPNALGVSVVSDANFWDARTWPMRMLDGSGVWELFCPGVGAGVRYKFLVTRGDGMRIFKADPLARAADHPPGTASIVEQSEHRWRDGPWMRQRARGGIGQSPFAIYEVHLGSWRRGPDGRVLNYREIAEPLADALPGDGIHARRAVADHGAPLWRVVGIPGHRLLRAHRSPRLPGRLPALRRRHASRRHRCDPRLGARPLPSRRLGACEVRRHAALRARRPASRRASRLGDVRLQLRTQPGAQLPGGQRALLGGGIPHRRPPRRCGRLDAVPRLFAPARAHGCRISTAATRTSRRSRCCAR